MLRIGLRPFAISPRSQSATQHLGKALCDVFPRETPAENGRAARSKCAAQGGIAQKSNQPLGKRCNIIFGDEKDSCISQRAPGFASFIRHNRQATGKARETAAALAGKRTSHEELDVAF